MTQSQFYSFRMMKSGSSSTPARPMMNNLPIPYDPSDEMMKSPACPVSMEVSNIVTPQSMAKDKRMTKWSLDDFHVGRRLGEGSFSTVILVEEKKTGFLCALKVIKVSKMALRRIPYISLSFAFRRFRNR